MTDLRKAAEQALNHLTNLQPYLGNGLLNKTQLAFVEPNIDEAMKALRQALEQNDLEEATTKGTKAWADVPDASEWVEQLRGNVDKVDISEERVHKTDKSIHEPVAWMKEWEDGHRNLWLYKPTMFDENELQPLYTAPPQKEWVGLTDKEVFLISEYPECCQVSIRNAEAKLKEKNGG